MSLDLGREWRMSGLIIGVFCGGFLLWSVLATIESAAIAPGRIAVASNVKKVQHERGGTIGEILVQEGEHVEQDQPLLTLDPTSADAQFQLNRQQKIGLMLTKTRLIAELEGESELDFPKDLLIRIDTPELQQMLKTQKGLFFGNKESFSEQLGILNDQQKQLSERLQTNYTQIEGLYDQQGYIEEELASLEVLAKKKLVRKNRILALKREQARLKQAIDQFTGEIKQIKEQQQETQNRIDFLYADTRKKSLQELQRVQADLGDTKQREKVAHDQLAKTTITAPTSGRVIGLAFHSAGEVIRPSEPIMQIVPKQDRLIIEARVSPTDVEMVWPGLRAKITFSGLSQRFLPNLEGVVEHVSPDVFEDQQSGLSFYQVRVSVPHAQVFAERNIELVPGMPVEVMILNESRSPMRYLVDPLLESFNRAFREQ